MGAGQEARVDVDLADLVGLAAVGADLGVQGDAAPDVGEDILEHGLGLVGSRRVVGVFLDHRGVGFDPDLFEGLLHGFLLGLGREDPLDLGLRHRFHGGLEVGLYLGGGDGGLGFAHLLLHLDLQLAEFFKFGLGGFHGADQVGVGELMGSAFHHQDAVQRAADDHFHLGGQALFVGGVHYELAFELAHADSGHGAVPRDVGDHQGRGGRVDGHHVGVIDAVVGHHHVDHLRLGVEVIREQRAHGAVRKAGGEHFFFAGFALALEEAAGDLAGRVGALFVVAAERHELGRGVLGLVGLHRGGEHHGVPDADDHGAAGLLGDGPGLE